jgi:hypothetical protein
MNENHQEEIDKSDILFLNQICQSRGVGLGLQISTLLAKALSPGLEKVLKIKS